MTADEKIQIGERIYLEFTGHDFELIEEYGCVCVSVYLNEEAAANLHNALGKALYGDHEE